MQADGPVGVDRKVMQGTPDHGRVDFMKIAVVSLALSLWMTFGLSASAGGLADGGCVPAADLGKPELDFDSASKLLECLAARGNGAWAVLPTSPPGVFPPPGPSGQGVGQFDFNDYILNAPSSAVPWRYYDRFSG
jgi:hypothetical protein